MQPPSPLALRLFHEVGRIRARMMLRGFERDAARARCVNRETLARILQRNRVCEWGRRFDFAALAREPERYRRALPLQRWTDVAPSVERMMRGETGVLCSEPILFFSLSSGTTGTSKHIPSTASSFAFQRRYYTGINPAVPASRLPGGFDPHRGISLLGTAGVARKTEGGTPVAIASANGISRVRRLVPYLWTSPYAAFEVEDLDALWYLHALFGLGERTAKFLNAVFAPHLASWLSFVESRWEALMRDLTDGQINKDLALSSAQRRALTPLVRADPARATELNATVAHGFGGFTKRAWPFLRYAATVITGPFAAALPRLRHYLDDLAIHTTVLSASEGMLGLNLDLDRPNRYVLCNGAAHFEFIPEESVDSPEPPTCDLAELTRGRSYELVVTNYAGFYRYRMGDLVQVVDFHGEAPVMAFRHRMGSVLDLVGEKTSEAQALAAVESAIGRGRLVDYTAWPDGVASPPRYVFYIEPAADELNANAVAKALDAALGAANPEYADCRAGDHMLAAPTVKLLRRGAFKELEGHRLAENPGVGHNQLKTPRLLRQEAWRQLLESRVLQDGVHQSMG